MSIKMNPELPPVVVAGAFQTGVNLMRDLARHGVRTFCVDCDASKQAFRTVYGKAFLCPNPDTNPAAWETFMIELSCNIGGRPVIIPSSDMFVTALSAHASALEPHFLLQREAIATQALLATKERQYEIAECHGLPVPRTVNVASVDEVRDFAATARFPCLIKPLHFREWRKLPPGHPLLNEKVALAGTPAELEDRYRTVNAITSHVVLQEIIAGPDTAKLVYLSCYARGGRRLGSCLLRELRTNPIHFGSASVTEPIVDPETDALCDQFFRSIKYEGICELELKRDSRDGIVRLIEANPRYSGTSDAATYAGVELGWLHYLDRIGQTPATAVGWNGDLFHHVVLQWDVLCFRSYLKQGLTTWREIRDSYRHAHFFDLDWNDRRLTWEVIRFVVKGLLAPTYRRIFRRG